MDFLKGKRDYAQEFKDAFLNTEIDKCKDIVLEWHKYTKNDANQDYADAMLASIIARYENDKTMLEQAEYIFNHPDSKCENPDLTHWYKMGAEVCIRQAKSNIKD